MNRDKIKILIFVVAYHAESTLEKVLARIPKEIYKHDTSILIIDDSSCDATFERGVKSSKLYPHIPITVLRNPNNQGYGGNQKLGYNYAIKNNFDVVVLLHGDGQYAPEYLSSLLEPILSNEAEVVFGSRMIKSGDALKGGMPFYKFLGNKILTVFQNMLMNTKLSEWHSGYRVYSVRLLSEIPFERNDNGFSFDTDIILQLLQTGCRIKEISIPTFYGDEMCYVNGMQYAKNICLNTLKCKLHKMNLIYERKYDCSYNGTHYTLKSGYLSSHSLVISEIKDKSSVLDIGCGEGLLSKELKRKKCVVVGIDQYYPKDMSCFDDFIQCKIQNEFYLTKKYKFDYILLLDIIEHITEPDIFLDSLRGFMQGHDGVVLISSANIAFLVNRLQLLIGRFNYVKRGVLDKTHLRLFTFSSLKKLFKQSGYEIIEVKGIPAPFPEVIKLRILSLLLVKVNSFLIRLCRNVFSYQIMIKAKPYVTVDTLLEESIRHSGELRDTLKYNQVNMS